MVETQIATMYKGLLLSLLWQMSPQHQTHMEHQVSQATAILSGIIPCVVQLENTLIEGEVGVPMFFRGTLPDLLSLSSNALFGWNVIEVQN